MVLRRNSTGQKQSKHKSGCGVVSGAARFYDKSVTVVGYERLRASLSDITAASNVGTGTSTYFMMSAPDVGSLFKSFIYFNLEAVMYQSKHAKSKSTESQSVVYS